MYFVNLSIMTKIKSYFCPVTTLIDAGSFVMKSIVMSC